MLRSPGLLTLAVSALAGSAQAVIRGVNLGGWLVCEPWLTQAMFNTTTPPSIDEWSLCNALGKDKCLQTLQQHWSTFYSRDDFVQMKQAGLNSVRIPLGYWAVDLLDYEPYVNGQYPYLIQAVQWAGEMGFTALIDVHGAPGSQNGWEETGLVGAIDFPANQTNADRTVKVLKNLTEEFSKPIYNGVVTNIELLNEPIFALPALKDFYTEGSAAVMNGSNTINVTIHDAFYNPPNWKNYDPNNPNAQTPAKRVTLDTHQFWGFPPLDNLTAEGILEHVCTFGRELRENVTGLLPVLTAEWSLNSGVTKDSSTDAQHDREKRTWFRRLFEAQNAAYSPNGPGQASIGWYYWTWKTDFDIDAWSYRKGVAMGYIPSNVSDPSTNAIPLLDNGCIDQNFTYQAPAMVTWNGGSTPTSSSTSSPSTGLGDGSASTTASSPSATASKKSDAQSVMGSALLAGVVPVGVLGLAVLL